MQVKKEILDEAKDEEEFQSMISTDLILSKRKAQENFMFLTEAVRVCASDTVLRSIHVKAKELAELENK